MQSNRILFYWAFSCWKNTHQFCGMIYLAVTDTFHILHITFTPKSSMIKVDTHFHPNFLRTRDKERKAKKIREKFEQVGLDAVIVAEHAYKKAQHAFEFLLQHKPLNSKTHLIPGVEVLTEEWADMIVFSQNPDIYQKHSKLTIPRSFSISWLVEYIGMHDDIFWIITHPFTLSKSAIANHISVDRLKEITKKIKLVERHNACLRDLRIMFEQSGFHKVFKKIHEKSILTESCPCYYDECGEVVCLTWSDAHHIDDIWTYSLINTNGSCKSNYNDLFQAVVNHNHPREAVFQLKNRFQMLRSLARNGFTSLSEAFIEKLRLYKLYQ